MWCSAQQSVWSRGALPAAARGAGSHGRANLARDHWNVAVVLSVSRTVHEGVYNHTNSSETTVSRKRVDPRLFFVVVFPQFFFKGGEEGWNVWREEGNSCVFWNVITRGEAMAERRERRGAREGRMRQVLKGLHTFLSVLISLPINDISELQLFVHMTATSSRHSEDFLVVR